MNAFDRIAGYKKEKEELMALAEIFKNRKNTSLKEQRFLKESSFTVRREQEKLFFPRFWHRNVPSKKLTSAFQIQHQKIIFATG